MQSLLDEILQLDLLTLRAHTELAGDQLQPDSHRAMLQASLQDAQLCQVRRHGVLLAYAMLRPLAGQHWLVTAFNTHPQHRHAPLLNQLFTALLEVAQRLDIRELSSHVYQTNHLSLAFHRRLGFKVVRENQKALEFHSSVVALLAQPALRAARAAAAQITAINDAH